MVWKATPEKNSFAIFFSPFGRRGLKNDIHLKYNNKLYRKISATQFISLYHEIYKWIGLMIVIICHALIQTNKSVIFKTFFLSSPSIKTCLTKTSFFIICMRFTYYIIQFILRIQSTIIIKKSGGCVFVRLPTHDVILDGMLAFYIHYFYIMQQAHHS